MTVTDKPNRQSNSSMLSIHNSGAVTSSSATIPLSTSTATGSAKPSNSGGGGALIMSPQGSFVIPISVDSQDGNRRVTFANDAYAPESPCTACCRSCMRCCRWLSRCSCCCSSSNEVTKYVDEHGEAVADENSADDDGYGYGAENSFYSFDNDENERDTASNCRKCCRKEVFGIKVRHWSYLIALLVVATMLTLYLCQWGTT